MTQEMKPCPFCGREPHSKIYASGAHYYCVNPRCACCMEEIADKVWNARPLEEKLENQVKEAVRQLEIARKLYAKAMNNEAGVWMKSGESEMEDFNLLMLRYDEALIKESE